MFLVAFTSRSRSALQAQRWTRSGNVFSTFVPQDEQSCDVRRGSRREQVS
jgi:hypothetical protein